jgi:hypothetical protein
MEEESVAQIITSSWEKVEALITIEEAMTSFLTQALMSVETQSVWRC